jgi:hypothetical protein
MTPRNPTSDAPASDVSAQGEGWDGLDGVETVRAAEAALRADMERIDARIAAPFLTPQGRECLAWLRERVLDKPSWRLGDTLATAYFAEGRKDIVRQLIASVDRAAAARPGGTNAAPAAARKPRKT